MSLELNAIKFLQEKYGIKNIFHEKLKNPTGDRGLFGVITDHELLKKEQSQLKKKYVLSNDRGIGHGRGLKDIHTFNSNQPDILRQLDFYLESENQSLDPLQTATEVETESFPIKNIEHEYVKGRKELYGLIRSEDLKNEIDQYKQLEKMDQLDKSEKLDKQKGTGKGKKVFQNSSYDSSSEQDESKEEQEEQKQKQKTYTEISDENTIENIGEDLMNKEQQNKVKSIIKDNDFKHYKGNKYGILFINKNGDISKNYRSLNELKDDKDTWQSVKQTLYSHKVIYGKPLGITDNEILLYIPSKVYNESYPTMSMKRRNKKKYKTPEEK
jgi:hypothetical protein